MPDPLKLWAWSYNMEAHRPVRMLCRSSFLLGMVLETYTILQEMGSHIKEASCPTSSVHIIPKTAKPYMTNKAF